MKPMRIAFYAPMNLPDEATPSGDRLIARQIWRGLEALGHEVVLASRLKAWATTPAALGALKTKAAEEVARLHDEPFDAWFTYHVYYKAPDLIGSWVARARGIPYFVAEASLSPKRMDGPWAEHSASVREALALADAIFSMSPRDYPALVAAGLETLVPLAPWVDAKAWAPAKPKPAPRGGPLRLLTTAMMREGDKVESYKLIAASLAGLEADWVLDIHGDGPARAEVEKLFEPLGSKVTFRGVADHPSLAQACGAADLFLWPGLGEGFGMVYLETQAAGLVCVACNGPGPSAALSDGSARLTAPTPEAYGWAIADLAKNETRRSIMAAAGRRLVEMRHSQTGFLRTLKETIEEHRP